jgi:hypothetical protein
MKLSLRSLVLALFCCFLVSPHAAHAHVGSKDVFEQVSAGPYKLFVTIRMPTVIPGVAIIETRSTGEPVNTIHITPLPLTGEASKHPPTSDLMSALNTDPTFFTGNLWLMRSGSWQVRFELSGPSGNQTVSVPVTAVAISTLKMQRGIGMTLAALGLFLFLSMAGIVAAAVREARLEPAAIPSPTHKRQAIIATASSVIFMTLLLWLGAKWWNVEAAGYALNIYRPLTMSPVLVGNQLDLNVLAGDPEKSRGSRSNQDFLPDHGHLMHLYAIRQPEMDAAFHLHPILIGNGDFRISLPVMPPGRYSLYGDVVHANGFPETLVTQIDVPVTMSGDPLGPEDASAHPQPLSQGQLGDSYKLPDGYRMVWDQPQSITANTAYAFRFHLLDTEGKPATDMQPYLGMAGHAAFVKTDGTVFAHTHPEGSAPMSSLMLANESSEGSLPAANPAGGRDMDPNIMKMDMSMHNEPISNTVEFPYGFPSPGRYRIFVQMKHGATVETGVFDATVQ